MCRHLTFVNTTETSAYGHSAVNDGNGNIFVFGGINGNGAVRKDMLVLDTKQPKEKWSLQFLSRAPEGRAFHTATLLPDKTILIMWGTSINSAERVVTSFADTLILTFGTNTFLGQTGFGAQSTYMLYDIKSNVWVTSTPQTFPTIIWTTKSPNTSKPGKIDHRIGSVPLSRWSKLG